MLSCSASTDHSAILQQAQAVHLAAVVIHDSVNTEIQELQSQVDALSASDSLEISLSNLKDSLAAIRSDFESWDANLMSVPGFDAAHNHSHEHDHAHEHHHPSQKLQDLPPEQILAVQQEIRKSVSHIHNPVKRLHKILHDH